jgi:hypothetical protein
VKYRYDFLWMLEKKGIVPSNTRLWKYDDVRAAIRESIGADPAIFCFTHEQNGKTLYGVMQFGLCLTRDLQLFQCAEEVYRAEFRSCASEYVWLPDIEHSVQN